MKKRKILLSLLGRPRKDEGGTEYNATQYEFKNGKMSERTSFVGLSLMKYIKSDHMVVLGTKGSNWDSLLESQNLGEHLEEKRIQLTEDCENQTVTQEQLQELEPMLEKVMSSKVSLAIIPSSAQDSDQLKVLEVMSQYVKKQDEVYIDITHAFRHLSLLVLMSALHLRASKKVTITQVYYGLYDSQSQAAKIYELGGLIHLSEWVSALEQFDKDNDYSVFSTLLFQSGLNNKAVEELKNAAFYERTTRPGQARGSLKKVRDALKKQSLTGVGQLFEQSLLERFSWVDENRSDQRQKKLAEHYLSVGDYLRCAVTTYEAFITALVKHYGGNENKYEDREKAKKYYDQDSNKKSNKYTDYVLLKNLRNALAHGNYSSRQKVQSALSSSQKLEQELKRLVDLLLINEKK